MQIIRRWGLIIAIITGIVGYFVYINIPILDNTHHLAEQTVSVAQPLLIFTMLFLTFCRINMSELRLCRWHLWLLLIQGGIFTLLGLFLIVDPGSTWRVVIEGAMICIICPTATAAAVITRKLGGSLAHVTTYTVLINLLAAILIPVMLPYVHPNPDVSITTASILILGKVFPLLLLPLVMGILVRRLAPPLHRRLVKLQDAPFYIWMVSLALAIAVTTRSIYHSTVDLSTQLWLVAVSLAACIAQFYFGRKIGSIYDDTVTAGQALGQKNTVFAIWLGYTFLTPVTSIAGGFYSIWHNVINSYQLYRHERQDSRATSHEQ